MDLKHPPDNIWDRKDSSIYHTLSRDVKVSDSYMEYVKEKVVTRFGLEKEAKELAEALAIEPACELTTPIPEAYGRRFRDAIATLQTILENPPKSENDCHGEVRSHADSGCKAESSHHSSCKSVIIADSNNAPKDKEKLVVLYGLEKEVKGLMEALRVESACDTVRKFSE